VNEKGKVMDVSGGVDAENRNIIVHARHGKVNQRWKVVYVDEYQENQRKESSMRSSVSMLKEISTS